MAITWNGAVWVAATAYVQKQRVVNVGNVYICTTPGTSAGSGGPTGTDPATPITDGSVVWQFLGANGGAVIDIAPDMSSSRITDQAKATYLGIVAVRVRAPIWGDLYDQGSMYLAAHLGKLGLLRGSGQITSEQLGQESRAYAQVRGIDGSLGLTSYGAEYLELLKMLPSSVGTLI